MGINFGSFQAVASSSFLSGGRRVVVDQIEAKVSAKGLWQQFKMSFMGSDDRKNMNMRTIASFRQVIHQHYGGEGDRGGDRFLEKLDKIDLTLQSKAEKGTKLLSRDVSRLIRVCEKIRAANLQEVTEMDEEKLRNDVEKAEQDQLVQAELKRIMARLTPKAPQNHQQPSTDNSSEKERRKVILHELMKEYMQPKTEKVDNNLENATHNLVDDETENTEVSSVESNEDKKSTQQNKQTTKPDDDLD